MARRVGSVAVLAFAGAALVIGVATGCSPTAPPENTARPTLSASPSEAPPRPTPTVLPELRPELAASENLPYFDSVNLGVIAANAEAGGRDFVDALAAAGFEKAQMEVTEDRTTVDLPADSVQFAVQFQGECLVGQYGSASGGYHSAVRPALGTGGCLVGQTRPIDW